jgi:hypothetical protein
MTRTGYVAVLALPVLMVACQPAPEPEPAPMINPAEAACAAAAAQATGVDAATVTVVPVASTKTGATVYEATVDGMVYTCVVEIDGTVSAFSL